MTKQFAVEVQQALDPAIEAVVAKAINDNLENEGPLLLILHQIQSDLKHIPKGSVAIIAEALNLSRAEVHGVISYYHTFTDKPFGKYTIEVCRAESCQAVGGRAIETKFKDTLGIDFGETSNDNLFSLEPVFCLGNCACSPSIRIGEKIYGRVTDSTVESLLTEMKTDINGAE